MKTSLKASVKTRNGDILEVASADADTVLESLRGKDARGIWVLFTPWYKGDGEAYIVPSHAIDWIKIEGDNSEHEWTPSEIDDG